MEINTYYNAIISALRDSANMSIPRIPLHSFKPFWNDELEQMKSDCIFWHNLWVDGGRASSGWLHQIKSSCKLKYKLAIKEAYLSFENKLDDEILQHFINKKIPDFWKVWNVKFKRNVSRQIHFVGCCDDADIANAFANKFSTVYSTNDSGSSDCCDRVYQASPGDETSKVTHDKLPQYTVELIESVVNRMKLGKACGPDELSAENLRFAHPALFIHLKLLFYVMFAHGYVPDKFGDGIIIPLIKDKTGDINSIDNYRPITLTPIVAKVFETLIMDLCESKLVTDELQFGFKKGVGCNDAIFTLKTIINHFTSGRSSVFSAALDIRKAFDRVPHGKLMDHLRKMRLPSYIIDVLSDWYDKLQAVVRWNGVLSRPLSVPSGVRQGGILSPALFNIFINTIIIRLRIADIGCHVKGLFAGCFILYVDDVILLSPSVLGLQRMLDVCYSTCTDLGLKFNGMKSHCICFGSSSKYEISA